MKTKNNHTPKNDINYMRNLNKLLPDNFLHIIYKDEINDQFILTKFGEIYPENENYLRLTCWSLKMYKIIKSGGFFVDRHTIERENILFDYYRTDNGLFQGIFHISDLPIILSFGIHKRRINLNGHWLKDKEKKLGHKIKPIYLKSNCTPHTIGNFNQKYVPNMRNKQKYEKKPYTQYNMSSQIKLDKSEYIKKKQRLFNIL